MKIDIDNSLLWEEYSNLMNSDKRRWGRKDERISQEFKAWKEKRTTVYYCQGRAFVFIDKNSVMFIDNNEIVSFTKLTSQLKRECKKLKSKKIGNELCNLYEIKAQIYRPFEDRIKRERNIAQNVRELIFELTPQKDGKYLCAVTGEYYERKNGNLDHLVALKDGGLTTFDNYRFICGNAHCDKTSNELSNAA